MKNTMIAGHSQWPIKDDVIFGLAKMAQDAKIKFGKDKVVDSTIGALTFDNGELVCMKSVYTELKSLPDSLIATYAPIAGTDDFQKAVEFSCFQDYRPDAYIRSVATPGGTGSIRHAIFNYTNLGDSVLVSDWHWAPYSTIAEEYGRNLKNYSLLNMDNEFAVESFEKEFDSTLKKQKRLVTIINTPAHNPTGYSLDDDDWDNVISIMVERSKNEEYKIILFVDVAYMEFAGKGKENKRFFKKFSGLPENILVIVGYSLSKGYTMYGMRQGAAIAISSCKDVVDEFYRTCSHSNRANWSNCNRGAMEVLTRIVNDKEKFRIFEAERNLYRDMLRKRADTFIKKADLLGLKMLHYRDGFFITLPTDNAKLIANKLIDENIFLVPLEKGIRFAVCAVSEENCRKVPQKIKNAMESLDL